MKYRNLIATLIVTAFAAANVMAADALLSSKAAEQQAQTAPPAATMSPRLAEQSKATTTRDNTAKLSLQGTSHSCCAPKTTAASGCTDHSSAGSSCCSVAGDK